MSKANQVLDAPESAAETIQYRGYHDRQLTEEELPDEVSPANPTRQKIQYCDDAEALRPWKHEGPYYRVELVITEYGPGSRQRTKKREIKRTILRRLCAGCLICYRHRFEFASDAERI